MVRSACQTILPPICPPGLARPALLSTPLSSRPLCCAGLIVGAPTWHTGADSERSGTAWDECAPLPVASALPPPLLCSAPALRALDVLFPRAVGWPIAHPHSLPSRFIYGDLTGLDLKGKKVAIFGLGDQGGYGDNFCDAMDELKTCFANQGAEIVGAWPTEGYDHMESKSVEGDKFVGLACDEDNQPDMSEERVKAWVAQIKGEGMPL